MAKGNTVVKKLMTKAKAQWCKRALGSATPITWKQRSGATKTQGSNGGVRFATRTPLPIRADYVRHAGKWKHYA